MDTLEHVVELALDLRVGESQHSVSLLVEPPSALLIVLPLIVMVIAIDLDDESFLQAHEIHDGVPQNVLPAEPAPQ